MLTIFPKLFPSQRTQSWHVTTTKLQKLLVCPIVDRVNVVPNVVEMWNEEGVLQLKGVLAQWYQP
jgi:hypothetical protein